MKSYVLMLIGIALITFQACNEGTAAIHDGYTITGKIDNSNPDMKIFLDDLQKTENRVIDTATVQSDGTFVMTGKVEAPTIAQLRIGFNKIFLILDNDKSEINLDARVPNAYELNGNSANNTWKSIYDKLRTRTATPQFLKSVVDSSDNILLGYLVLNQMKIENEYEAFKTFLKKMQSKMPNSSLTKDMANRVKQAASLANLSVGKPAPDINLSSPDGENISLSSLKGNVVLLDFWASWCRPCRRENPTVVKAYDKYKSKGFTVYSVSLDKSAPPWEKAIKDDNLKWNNHVSDLKGWKSSAAALYGVRSIPQTFLIGKDGNIVAKNLRGPALEAKLSELL